MSQVQITCETQDASIYYTLDGTNPDKSSSLYSSALDINENLTVKAKAYKEGWVESDMTSLDISVLPKLPIPIFLSVVNCIQYIPLMVIMYIIQNVDINII